MLAHQLECLSLGSASISDSTSWWCTHREATVSSTWVFVTHGEIWIKFHSWLWSGPAPDLVGILGVNQWIDNLSFSVSVVFLSLCLAKKKKVDRLVQQNKNCLAYQDTNKKLKRQTIDWEEDIYKKLKVSHDLRKRFISGTSD